ncbi:NOX4 [Symbiodinium natans]|uniref:NOX4 protein n=1 Tax=Symbiodinium natans TaxID=878477 RepID=A0A812JJF9_9DINO|nr:NOX4 [Symbiodinium natans]
METKRIMDVAIFTGFTLLILMALLGALLAKTPSKAWFMPRFQSWSVANITAAAAGAIIVLCVAASPDSVFRLNSTGNATGMAMWVTLLFSFYKFGLHDILRMSREAAWRIHYVFGILTIVIASFHGVLVFHRLGPHAVFHRLLAVFGLVGLILMILGVVPAFFVRYDRWKCLHFFSFLGLMFTIYHTVVAAFIHKTPVSIITAILDSAVVLAYLGQKIYTHVSSKYAVVQKAEVAVEPASTHLLLDLGITGFTFKPGGRCTKTTPAGWGWCTKQHGEWITARGRVETDHTARFYYGAQAHAGTEGNERADALANAGRTQGRNGGSNMVPPDTPPQDHTPTMSADTMVHAMKQAAADHFPYKERTGSASGRSRRLENAKKQSQEGSAQG